MITADLIRQWEKEIDACVREIRHELHMHPELAFQEFETAAIIRRYLAEWGIPFRTVETGTIADIAAEKEGKVIALRADIDALPIQEETGEAFASQNPGKMHACGHDAHTAMLLCAGKILWENRHLLPGPVRLIFQPAEEDGGGAQGMIAAGALENVEAIYCLHMGAGAAAGQIVTKPGYVQAASDAFEVTINGTGCHGAHPDLGVDAIVVSSHVILALQDLVSREINPLEPTVLTIGKIEGGTARNIICGQVILHGTLRTLNRENRGFMQKRIEEVACGVANVMRGSAQVEFLPGYCATFNHEENTRYAQNLVESIWGKDSIRMQREASMGAEDFGFYAQEVPGVKMGLGTGRKEGIHTATFGMEEEALSRGVAVFCALAGRLQP